MAPFDRSHTSFYSPSIVTITLSCTVTHYDDMLSHFHLIPERHGWTDSVLTCDKNRNNLLMKLAGSTWGASANTLRSSTLALCYSAVDYCTQVWSRSAHTSQVDVQLNSTMRLISGTLRSTPLPWLPVLSNIEPPALRRKAATDKLVEKIIKHDSWPVQPDILNPPLLRLTSRKPL